MVASLFLWCRAIAGIDEQAAKAIIDEKKFRFRYTKYMTQHVRTHAHAPARTPARKHPHARARVLARARTDAHKRAIRQRLQALLHTTRTVVLRSNSRATRRRMRSRLRATG